MRCSEDEKETKKRRKSRILGIDRRHIEQHNEFLLNIISDASFDCTEKELRNLMDLRGSEALEKIVSTYGGVNGLCKRLKTDPIKGLPNDSAELAKRRRIFGKNEIPPSASRSFLHLAWEALQDTSHLILMAAALVSLGISFYKLPNGGLSLQHLSEEAVHWIDPVAILVAVVVVVLVMAFNDWSTERQFRGLQSHIAKDHRFSVIRGGEAHDVVTSELVVGDIGRVKYGDTLPADGVLIQSNDLKIDESSLTGESDLIKKATDADPMLLSGTHAMEGSGRFIITAVGLNSRTGIIMSLLGAGKAKSESKNNEDCTTPAEKYKLEKSIIQHKLEKLAVKLGYVGTVIGLLTIAILLVRFCIFEYAIGGQALKMDDINHIVEYVIIGVTILVIAVPEGLPLAITLSLSYSVKKMMLDKNLVRHLDACETMGSATTICSDKTGTLTTNRMTVVQSYINGTFNKQILPTTLDYATRELIIEGISVNSGYSYNTVEPVSPGGQRTQLGNKTECALLGFVLDLGGNFNQIRAAHPEESLFKVYTFNSTRKSMMTVIRLANGGYRVYAKGASEHILARCTCILGAHGRLEPFDENNLASIIREVIEPMASAGLRTIGLAYKDFVPVGKRETENEEEFAFDIDWEDEKAVSNGMTAIAVVGIQDPVRPEVPAAIAKVQNAGVIVRMVTGDNINTARSIAIACGILKPGEDFLALESSEFNILIRDENGNVNQKKLDEIWPKLRVLARAQPTDKYVLVNGIIDSKISKNREVVAVTGDGTNDAPALKKSDVGFAMGIAGTDIAKEASDIILTDDNFSSIVKAVMWGRNVYDSIAKFLQFEITVTVVAVSISFISSCAISDSPFKAVQMLWVNLIQDTFSSLALATEMPTEALLNRKPYGRTKPLISRNMLKFIVGHSIYQIAVLCVLLFWGGSVWGTKMTYLGLPPTGPHSNEPSAHYTIIFNAFMLMTLCNMINARKIHGERNVLSGLHRNPFFCVIWIVSMIVHVIFVQYGGHWVHTHPLTHNQWGVCIALGLGALVWGQAIACVPVYDEL